MSTENLPPPPAPGFGVVRYDGEVRARHVFRGDPVIPQEGRQILRVRQGGGPLWLVIHVVQCETEGHPMGEAERGRWATMKDGGACPSWRRIEDIGKRQVLPAILRIGRILRGTAPLTVGPSSPFFAVLLPTEAREKGSPSVTPVAIGLRVDAIVAGQSGPGTLMLEFAFDPGLIGYAPVTILSVVMAPRPDGTSGVGLMLTATALEAAGRVLLGLPEKEASAVAEIASIRGEPKSKSRPPLFPSAAESYHARGISGRPATAAAPTGFDPKGGEWFRWLAGLTKPNDVTP